jgi:protein-S-isoprenylcysteine O-methyltransferase Ste14
MSIGRFVQAFGGVLLIIGLLQSVFPIFGHATWVTIALISAGVLLLISGTLLDHKQWRRRPV